MLDATLIRVGVIENPIAVGGWQIRVMPILCHEIDTHSGCMIGLILVQVKPISMRGVPCPCTDRFLIAPNEMRRLAVWIDDVERGTVGIGGPHTR